MYNTRSYATIVTPNLYVNTSFFANGGLHEAEAFLSCSGHLSFQKSFGIPVDNHIEVQRRGQVLSVRSAMKKDK